MLILLIIIFLLLFLAMMCRSLVHTLIHHYAKFDEKYDADNQWWNPGISWTNKKTIFWTIKILNWTVTRFKIPVQVSDGFHLFNTVELGCYDAIISILLTQWLALEWYYGIIIFLIIGIVLMPALFNWGYDKIWRK